MICAASSGAHTYRLLFVKDQAISNYKLFCFAVLFVFQQQRSEIMNYVFEAVNSSAYPKTYPYKKSALKAGQLRRFFSAPWLILLAWYSRLFRLILLSNTWTLLVTSNVFVLYLLFLLFFEFCD
jgi:hypothetical protein